MNPEKSSDQLCVPRLNAHDEYRFIFEIFTSLIGPVSWVRCEDPTASTSAGSSQPTHDTGQTASQSLAGGHPASPLAEEGCRSGFPRPQHHAGSPNSCNTAITQREGFAEPASYPQAR